VRQIEAQALSHLAKAAEVELEVSVTGWGAGYACQEHTLHARHGGLEESCTADHEWCRVERVGELQGLVQAVGREHARPWDDDALYAA